MQRGISRTCALFAVALLCRHMGLLPAVAQQPLQTREGIVTTFAPVVEKVAPSVVTVFTTQTISRGQAAFSLSDDALRQLSTAAVGKEKANRRCKTLDRV